MAIKKFKISPLPIPQREYDYDQTQQMVRTLELYFGQLDNFLTVVSTVSSGATTARPTLDLQIGEYYFDTTLGRPIWYDGTNWVDATGTTV